MRKSSKGLMAAFAAAVSLSGCDTGPGQETSSNESAPAADGDLTVGSRGESVQAAHDYLARFGYLPNPELARTYPSWRPLVAQGPADRAVFDAHSAEAVRALQAFFGIPVTGIVDAATRELMHTPRCGVPEGIEALDPSDKFAGSGQKWNKTVVRWHVKNTPISTGLNSTEVGLAVQAALDTWGVNGVELFPEANRGDIEVGFAKIDGLGTGGFDVLGRTTYPNDGGDVTLDVQDSWSTTGAPGTNDVETVLLHELGHALGLAHSGFRGARMFPTITAGARALSIDDQVAFGALYNTFFRLPGTAKDIGVSSESDPSIWIISSEPFGNGFRVKHFNGTDWDSTDGGAVRIAVGPDGIPWLVDSVGQIWRRTTTDPFVGGAWQLLPGRARDIGVGADGTAWVLGVDSVPGGSGVHRFNGSFWVRAVDGAAVKIAVDEGGRPWVVNSSGRVFRRTTSDPSVANAWTDLGGNASDVAVAIGGSGRHAWAVGSESGNLRLSVWNEQPSVAGKSGSTAPRKFQFDMGKTVGAGGSGIAVSVDATGRPWVVDHNGVIFTARRQ